VSFCFILSLTSWTKKRDTANLLSLANTWRISETFSVFSFTESIGAIRIQWGTSNSLWHSFYPIVNFLNWRCTGSKAISRRPKVVFWRITRRTRLVSEFSLWKIFRAPLWSCLWDLELLFLLFSLKKFDTTVAFVLADLVIKILKASFQNNLFESVFNMKYLDLIINYFNRMLLLLFFRAY